MSEVYKLDVNKAAEIYDITPNSVADKLTHKCEMKKIDWLPMLKGFLARGDISSIAFTLRNNARGCELAYVKDFISEMQQNSRVVSKPNIR